MTIIDLTGDAYHYWSVDVKKLAQFADPLADDVWGVGVIDPNEILSCTNRQFGSTPSSMMHGSARTREYHIARISYLMEHGWEENPNEEMRLYSPKDYFESLLSMSEDAFSPAAIRQRQRLRITDGNHRFCAALLSGAETLKVEPYGDLSFLFEALNPVSAL